jgi:Fur family ferric uptake transcriptional regulator
MEGKTYRTRQRELILQFLQGHRSGHVTAEEVWQGLRSQGETLGKSTVYRYLDLLVSQGVLRKYAPDSSGSCCYQLLDEQGCCREHFHLKCARCGRLTHLECDYLEKVSQHLLQDHDFEIDAGKTVFYGLCASCAAASHTH